MYLKPISLLSEEKIEHDWDLVAEERDYLIQEGKDISLINITEPFILKKLKKYQPNYILDCGCGTGHLSNLITQKLQIKVDAIDISGKSINIASEKYKDNHYLNFHKNSIIEQGKSKNEYYACISNMVLMDTINLEENLDAIYKMLKSDGKFIFTITHPCFWPIYWNYFKEPWFDYSKEIFIKAPLKINNNTMAETTHIHRPLNMYISNLKKAGFKIISIEELNSHNFTSNTNHPYNYPRFMGFVCQK